MVPKNSGASPVAPDVKMFKSWWRFGVYNDDGDEIWYGDDDDDDGGDGESR